MPAELSGVISLVVTPMHPDFSINYDALRSQIDWSFAHGATGITATPSIGEFPFLSRDERIRVMEVTLEQTRKHGGVALATTAGVATLDTLDYTRLAAQMGYDYAVVIAPYYWRVGEKEVLRHFYTLADDGGIPIIVYHNPALSKFTITPGFAGKLADHPNIVAIKEVETDLERLEELVEEIAGKMKYLQTFRAYLAGRVLGSVGGTINVFAVPACVAIDRAWHARDIDQAEVIQHRLNMVFPRGGESALGAIGMTKVCASVTTGIQMGPVRPPYMAPDDAEERLTRRLPRLAEVVPAMNLGVRV